MLLDLIAGAEKRLFPARARRWRRWKTHAAHSTARLEHGAWDEFLARHRRVAADGSTRIAYREIGAGERAGLDAYLGRLAAADVDALSRDEQMAFWCNLYNALTVRAILDHYPLRSFRDVGSLPAWLGGGPWSAKRITVAGWRLGLNDIEHRILRRNWRDRRVHYALNCGALACPDLAPRAYTGDTVQGELDRAERAYVNDARGVAFDGERMLVSSIYVWFEADFVAPDESIVDYLRRHAEPRLAERLAGRERPDGHRYDWSLNDASVR